MESMPTLTPILTLSLIETLCKRVELLELEMTTKTDGESFSDYVSILEERVESLEKNVECLNRVVLSISLEYGFYHK